MMLLMGASSSLSSGGVPARRLGFFMACLVDEDVLRNVAFLPIVGQATRDRPMDCTIRPALADDAADISGVILRALRETNAKDYTDEIIERVERSFSPNAVRALIAKRTVF